MRFSAIYPRNRKFFGTFRRVELVFGISRDFPVFRIIQFFQRVWRANVTVGLGLEPGSLRCKSAMQSNEKPFHSYNWYSVYYIYHTCFSILYEFIKNKILNFIFINSLILIILFYLLLKYENYELNKKSYKCINKIINILKF